MSPWQPKNAKWVLKEEARPETARTAPERKSSLREEMKGCRAADFLSVKKKKILFREVALVVVVLRFVEVEGVFFFYILRCQSESIFTSSSLLWSRLSELKA